MNCTLLVHITSFRVKNTKLNKCRQYSVYLNLHKVVHFARNKKHVQQKVYLLDSKAILMTAFNMKFELRRPEHHAGTNYSITVNVQFRQLSILIVVKCHQ